MIFRNSTLIFLIILVLIGCQGRRVEVVLNENIKLFKTFPKEDSVFFKNMKELKGITPSQIHKVDSTLILFNFSRKKNGYCFFNFSLKKNELSKGYLSYGRGPNEVIGPFGSMVKDGKLWMYDVTTKKLMSTDLKKALNDSDTPFKSFPIEKDHYQIAPLDSISFFSVGESTSLSKIHLYDLNTQKTLK
jgi:hypothetical protein